MLADSQLPQPAPLGSQTERIVQRIARERAAAASHADPAPPGPLAPPPAADRGADATDRGADADDEESDADEEETPSEGAPLSSLEHVIAALEAEGVRIDRSSLPGKKRLQQPITLPQGGAERSTQRALLKKAGVAMLRGIAGAVNPDGEGTARMIAEEILPPPPLEERQRAAADRVTAQNCIESYLDAKRRGLSKAEQRQRLSPLVPRTGRQGYTRPMLNREHDLNLSRCAHGVGSIPAGAGSIPSGTGSIPPMQTLPTTTHRVHSGG